MKNVGVVFIFLILTGAYCRGIFIPFVSPAESNPDSQIVIPFETFDESGRIQIADGHFVNAGGRIRIWGVNLSFGANFPTHEDAEKIAQRMAAAGINSVRCHHMDSARWPRGIWDSTGRKFHPEALDRLDYFIDQLARHGIHTNLNLHVGKAHSRDLDIPDADDHQFRYDKMISIFTPQIIEAQKTYAYNLLNHVNQYRKIRYADDPAVAFVEITNENSLFMWSAAKALPHLPPFYADILQQKFNQWLKDQYGTDQGLRKAWLGENVPYGEDLIKNGRFQDFPQTASVPSGWMIEQHDGCKAQAQEYTYKNQKALLIKPIKIKDASWLVQFNQRGFKVEKGKPYTLFFKAASYEPRSLSFRVDMGHKPWSILGLDHKIDLDDSWSAFQASFIPNTTEDNTRLTFMLGDSSRPLLLADIRLQPGAEYSLGDESIENGTVAVFTDSESKPRKLDRMMFLAEAEKSYFDGMRNYIKDELGYQGLVTGTIVFGPLGLWSQSDMDYIDAHAYWQHPRFPGRPWDRSNWLIDQKAMSSYPEQSTLLKLAAQRLEGKPYTISEYNHPAPLDSQAECVPMIASFAACQDWDGVWLYTYSHSSDEWDRDHLNSFFDIDTNPAKWGFVPAGALLFRKTGIYPIPSAQSVPLKIPILGIDPQYSLLHDLAQIHALYGSDLASFYSERKDASPLTAQSSLHFQEGMKTINISPVWHTDLVWNEEKKNSGVYLAEGHSNLVCAGTAERFESATKGQIQVSSPKFAAVTVTPLKRDSGIPNAYLVTASGRCENTGMKFSPDRRTVGSNWGRGPVQIEAVEAVIRLPIQDETGWICYALNPDGTIKQAVVIEDKTIQIHPLYKTMWYLLKRKGH